jgi:hypothetical protein
MSCFHEPNTNFNLQHPPLSYFWLFTKKMVILNKICSSFEGLLAYEVLCSHVIWLKFYTHLRSLTSAILEWLKLQN